MKKLITLVLVMVAVAMVGGCKDKKEPTLKEKQAASCKEMIQTKAKLLVKGAETRAGTKILENKVFDYMTKNGFNVLIMEAYVDFNGLNNFRGRWGCVFKEGTTKGIVKLLTFKGSNGKWKESK